MSCLTIDDIYKAKYKLPKHRNQYCFYPPTNCGKSLQIIKVAKGLGLCPICVNKCYEYLKVIK